VATLVTGELFGPILTRLVDGIRVPGLRAQVVPVPNEFFGRAITVTGLLTGEDIARALSGRPLGDAVLIPRVALTESKGVFLDDVVPDDLARHLGAPLAVVEPTAKGLVDGLLGRAPAPA
jgi:NifB/MoaA-like Fe-S oxidoreductase